MDLQVFGYLDVLQNHSGIAEALGVRAPLPVAAFLAPVRGKAKELPKNRDEALRKDRPSETHSLEGFYRRDRFDRIAGHGEGSGENDLVPYRLTKDGELSGQSRNHLSAEDFQTLIDGTREWIRNYGNGIVNGEIGVDPYDSGSCDHCGYASVCRIDPLVHRFRKDRKA